MTAGSAESGQGSSSAADEFPLVVHVAGQGLITVTNQARQATTSLAIQKVAADLGALLCRRMREGEA